MNMVVYIINVKLNTATTSYTSKKVKMDVSKLEVRATSQFSSLSVNLLTVKRQSVMNISQEYDRLNEGLMDLVQSQLPNYM